MPEQRRAIPKGPNQCATPGCYRKNLLPIDPRCENCRKAERERQERNLPPETPRA